MRFHRVDVRRAQPGVGEGAPDDALLRGAVRCGEAVAGSVLVDSRSPDEGPDGPVVPFGVGQPLQQQQRRALAESGAVGAVRERLAAAVGGQPALPAERHQHDGVDMMVTPPASASSHSPRRSAAAARCRETSEDEQAVSTLTAGPVLPRK